MIELFAKTTVDVILSHEVPARRLKRDSSQLSEDNSTEVEMTIWLKDFPSTLNEFKALYALKQGVHGVILVEEKFIPEEVDDYSLQPSNSLNQNPSQLQLQLEEERKRNEERAKVEFTPEERL